MRLDNEDLENGLQLVPGSHGINVPSACTNVIIAGCRLTDNHKLNLRKHFPLQVNTSDKWTRWWPRWTVSLKTLITCLWLPSSSETRTVMRFTYHQISGEVRKITWIDIIYRHRGTVWEYLLEKWCRGVEYGNWQIKPMTSPDQDPLSTKSNSSGFGSFIHKWSFKKAVKMVDM